MFVCTLANRSHNKYIVYEIITVATLGADT